MENSQVKWHINTIEEVSKDLETCINKGLSDEEVIDRLQRLR
jgi:hypothetical protein